MRFISHLMVIFLLCLGSVHAQGGGRETTLLGVRVEGNILTSTNTIRYTAGLKEGDLLKAGDFSRSVKRLWQLGLFSNIQIHLDEETLEGIKIIIQVEENPILGEVRFKGNKKIKDRKLEEELDLHTGQRIKPHLLEETAQKIKDIYADDGYLLAEVTPELMETQKDEFITNAKAKALTRDIVFRIRENRKVKIRNISFSGNEAFSEWRLRRALKETKQQRWWLFWRSNFDKEKFEEDKTALEAYYRNRGYRDITILADTLEYGEDRRKMHIRFTLREGPQYHFRNFSWEGQTLFTEDQLERQLNIDNGEVYSEEDFNLALYDRVQGLYMDRGYIYSQIEPLFTPVGEDSLDVHFVITENHKVYIRNIYVKGNTKTRENVIRRQLRIFPGDVFNRGRLIRSQREVWILNYFGNVVPDVVPVDEDEVDLEVIVEEKSSDRASANVGFTQTFGVTGGGGVEFTNFRGLGQRLQLSFNVGTNYSFYSSATPSKYQSFSLSFTDPMVRDTPNLLGFSLFYSFRGYTSGTYAYNYPIDYTVAGGSLSWGRLFKWPDDFFRGNWSFRIAQTTYAGDEEDLKTYRVLTDKSLGINLTQVITRDSRDRPEFTTRGSTMAWRSTLSGGPLGGNEDFHKHSLDLEWYTPTFWKFVLMSSFKMGVIKRLPSSKGELSILPFNERFIMGGNGIPYGNMLRGYPDNAIGPQTSSSRPLGGNALLRYTTEFRVPFSENPVVYALAFAEMGNVWSSLTLAEDLTLPRTGPLDLKRAAGVGIRFFMPMIGMLGFDMGYGFDSITPDGKPQGWEYTITFGQPF